MRINENQKVTLTLGQLKRLVKESDSSSNLKEKVIDFMDFIFGDWVALACDDGDEFDPYELAPSDAKEYARERMQEAADNVEDFYDNYCDDEFDGFEREDVIEALKSYLIDNGYDVQ